MNIKVGKSRKAINASKTIRKSIHASRDYATLRGMDFSKARDILTKDGFHEHEYGDKDDNNGYAVYRKGDKEVELQYRWNAGKRKNEYHAGKVTNVYVDDDINGACGKKSVKASRRPVKASRTLEIFTFDELTPEQQDYVLQNWSDMRKLAEVIYDWYNDDIMFAYQDEKQYIADKYANQYGLSINPDKLYWQSNSQGPYPEWDLSQVFDEYQLNDGTEIYFYGRGLDVEAETDSWGEEVESPEIDEVVGHAQEYIDEMWKYINDVCQAYPDDEWVEGTFESNPDAFEFIITDSGEVKYY